MGVLNQTQLRGSTDHNTTKDIAALTCIDLKHVHTD